MVDKVLNMSRILNIPASENTGIRNIPKLWIGQGSEYASGSGCDTVLNTPGLRKVLNMPE